MRNFGQIGAVVLVALVAWATCDNCDLQHYFRGREVSVEENTALANVVFRGLTAAAILTSSEDGSDDAVTAHFELMSTYKGEENLIVAERQVNVTFRGIRADCDLSADVPLHYIVFCEPDENSETLKAVSVARWSEETESRVWKTLGWSSWSDWSSCSASCSGGIQTRNRHCLLASCPGYNVEQRHCNLFGCMQTVSPLALEDRRFFHPSRAKWERVPDRPTAWKLHPNCYIWVPSSQLFPNQPEQSFPREFSLFVTLRLQNDSRMGTLFSLRSRQRQDAYLSLELAGRDALNLVHAASNGTDTVRIPAPLGDNRWHQLAISIRDDSTVHSYVDCEWQRTDILKKKSLDTPDDSDLIIGYLFSGDLEQMSVVPDSTMVSLQCSPQKTPIMDASLAMKYRNSPDRKAEPNVSTSFAVSSPTKTEHKKLSHTKLRRSHVKL